MLCVYLAALAWRFGRGVTPNRVVPSSKAVIVFCSAGWGHERRNWENGRAKREISLPTEHILAGGRRWVVTGHRSDYDTGTYCVPIVAVIILPILREHVNHYLDQGPITNFLLRPDRSSPGRCITAFEMGDHEGLGQPNGFTVSIEETWRFLS